MFFFTRQWQLHDFCLHKRKKINSQAFSGRSLCKVCNLNAIQWCLHYVNCLLSYTWLFYTKGTFFCFLKGIKCLPAWFKPLNDINIAFDCHVAYPLCSHSNPRELYNKLCIIRTVDYCFAFLSSPYNFAISFLFQC